MSPIKKQDRRISRGLHIKHDLLILCVLITTACGRPEPAPDTQPVSNAPAQKHLLVNSSGPTNLSHYLDSTRWNQLFPHRRRIPAKNGGSDRDFYSYAEFYNACRIFPGFLAEGDSNVQKRELAALLANVAQETSGGWATAPGGYFTWGLYFTQEQDTTRDYWDLSRKAYPPVAGRKYFGRGILQLSGNYNYGQFSDAWFGDTGRLLKFPEHVALDPTLAICSGLWFWMTPQYPKPSCHDIMVGKWRPNAADSAGGRLPGFGATLNVINGGVECGKERALQQTSYRYQYYRYFCRYFHVPPGDNVECGDQKPFGQ